MSTVSDIPSIAKYIERHPNLLVNYRQAALALVLALDMKERGESGPRRDRHLVTYGRLLGMAQGWLFKRYGYTIDGTPYTHDLARRMANYGGPVSITGFEQ